MTALNLGCKAEISPRGEKTLFLLNHVAVAEVDEVNLLSPAIKGRGNHSYMYITCLQPKGVGFFLIQEFKSLEMPT